jgi:hypothetical protein
MILLALGAFLEGLFDISGNGGLIHFCGLGYLLFRLLGAGDNGFFMLALVSLILMTDLGFAEFLFFGFFGRGWSDRQGLDVRQAFARLSGIGAWSGAGTGTSARGGFGTTSRR